MIDQMYIDQPEEYLEKPTHSEIIKSFIKINLGKEKIKLLDIKNDLLDKDENLFEYLFTKTWGFF